MQIILLLIIIMSTLHIAPSSVVDIWYCGWMHVEVDMKSLEVLVS